MPQSGLNQDMETVGWTEEDTQRADAIWAEYSRTHDLSTLVGQTAGIDPHSGRIWFGESIPDVVRRRDEDGVSAPLFAVRVGFNTYYRKGGHR